MLRRVGSAVAALTMLTACGGRSIWVEDGAGGAQDGLAARDHNPPDRGHDDPCGKGLKGAWMVRIPVSGGGSFCIDSTEVTRNQYAAFLGAGVPLSEQPSICSWNDTFWPWYWTWQDGQNEGELPVVGLDWCDARAYCTWAGKRLCGRIGGGTVSLTDAFDPLKDEWEYACSAGGTRNYPYGNAYQAEVCVTDDLFGPEVPQPVRSLPGCVGGFAGLYDMSGNVAEWEDASDQSTGPDDDVAFRGGGFSGYGPLDNACGSVDSGNRQSYYGAVGMRCCKDGPS